MIPRKIFDRLTTSLVYFRTNPCLETDTILMADESEANWPFNASQEQLDEWKSICDRTRAEFEAKVIVLKGLEASQ